MREEEGIDEAAGEAGEPVLRLAPIGIVRTAMAAKADAPRQPAAAGDEPARIELLPNRHFEHALDDLEGWDHVWVIYWFHLNRGWRPKVLPPRSTTGRKGVFATRSPHRPNPLGLSAVRLERVEGLTLHIRGADMVDGTPVLDIKPYVPYSDAHPEARSGWLEQAAARPGATTPADPVPTWQVEFAPLAAAQAGWIEQRSGLALADRIRATLALGPKPNPYRRIKREGDAYRLAVKDWRVRFSADGRRMLVQSIQSGYRPSQLAKATDPAVALHREFSAVWPIPADG